MKKAEILLEYMDELQKFIETINSYLEKGAVLISKLMEWVEKIIGFIKTGIDYLVNSIGGRKDNLQLVDDYLFV